METLSRDELFSIAIELDLPGLLSFCSSSKRINDLVCKRNDIWLYRIRKDFPNYKLRKSENPKKIYILLTKELKRVGEFQENRGPFLGLVGINEPLYLFLKNAKFDKTTEELIQPLIDAKTFNVSLLVMLFQLYFHQHNLKIIEDGRQFNHIDEVMEKYLKEYIVVGESREEKY